mgnify:CR=1
MHTSILDVCFGVYAVRTPSMVQMMGHGRTGMSPIDILGMSEPRESGMVSYLSVGYSYETITLTFCKQQATLGL